MPLRSLALFACFPLIFIAFHQPPTALAQQSVYTFEGSGWGHGVGMCQYGARGMAERGYTYAQIIGHYYRNAKVSKCSCPTAIKVGLIEQATELSLRVDVGGFVIKCSGKAIESAEMKIGETWKVAAAENGQFLIRKPDGMPLNGRTYGSTREPLQIIGTGTSSVLRIPENSNRAVWRLTEATPLEVRIFEKGGFRLRLILNSPFEEYLLGIAEVPGRWPLEAVKAQAVAARSYALVNMGKHSVSGFDVCDEVHCQYYQGHEKEGDIGWVDAVRATSGEAAIYEGKVANCVYSSSCGGHTDNNEDVWSGSPIPYLRGVPCPYCLDSANPNASWSVRMTREEIENRLLSRGIDIGTLLSCDLSNRTSSGRVRNAAFVGTSGKSVLSGESLRGLLKLKSAMVRLSGSDVSNFTEYILVSNFGKSTAKASVELFSLQGKVHSADLLVPPLSRKTLKVNDYLPGKDVSVVVRSEDSLVAERSMYFNYAGRIAGGSSSSGTRELSDRWYFAEGYTGGDFDTWILVFNPAEKKNDVTLKLMRDDGLVRKVRTTIKPLSRTTFSVDRISGFEKASFCAQVSSRYPVVAERSSYFIYGGRAGGHSSPGAPRLSGTWHFAEGYSAPGFDTWFLIGNPGEKTANVTLNFHLPHGEKFPLKKRVKPHSRYTFFMNDALPHTESALTVSSDQPVIAERSMYFNYKGIDGGSCAMGVTRKRGEWLFAEGYTSTTFDEYILVSNPERSRARVRLTFIGPGGVLKRIYKEIRPFSRFTVRVNEHAINTDVSVRINSLNGIKVVVERSMYFDYGGIKGGHASAGIEGASSSWYFAEGYTGK